MHASTIEEHQRLTHEANELVYAWRGTDPMSSDADVRRALVAADADPAEIDALLPYVVDACLAASLLVDGDEVRRVQK